MIPQRASVGLQWTEECSDGMFATKSRGCEGGVPGLEKESLPVVKREVWAVKQTHHEAHE